MFRRDLEAVKVIHEKYYNEEFPFSDLNNFMASFVVIDDKTDKVVTAGGIKTIVEGIIVTDKDLPIETKQSALLNTLQIMTNMTKQAGYNQLHVSVQDERWMRHLIKHGFKPTKGTVLVIGV